MNTLIVICGPTACGKTPTAIALAKMINGEIVSADSKQIYRGMDIGTAKPAIAEREGIPHHLFDVAEPGEDFSAKLFQQMATKVIDDIFKRGKTPILAGGTGFYINAAIYENALDRKEDEILQARYKAQFFILHRDRAKLYEAINQRVETMIKQGLAAEVEILLNAGVKENSTAMQALGYKEMLPYLRGQCSLDETVKSIQQGSRRYAKRQLTWFRHQIKGHWLSMDEMTVNEAAEKIRNFLQI